MARSSGFRSDQPGQDGFNNYARDVSVWHEDIIVLYEGQPFAKQTKYHLFEAQHKDISAQHEDASTTSKIVF